MGIRLSLLDSLLSLADHKRLLLIGCRIIPFVIACHSCSGISLLNLHHSFLFLGFILPGHRPKTSRILTVLILIHVCIDITILFEYLDNYILHKLKHNV